MKAEDVVKHIPVFAGVHKYPITRVGDLEFGDDAVGVLIVEAPGASQVVPGAFSSGYLAMELPDGSFTTLAQVVATEGGSIGLKPMRHHSKFEELLDAIEVKWPTSPERRTWVKVTKASKDILRELRRHHPRFDWKFQSAQPSCEAFAQAGGHECRLRVEGTGDQFPYQAFKASVWVGSAYIEALGDSPKEAFETLKDDWHRLGDAACILQP